MACSCRPLSGSTLQVGPSGGTRGGLLLFGLYKLAWYLHFKFVAPRIADPDDSLLVVASSLMINRKKKAVKEAVDSVVTQVAPTLNYESSFLPALCDPCLQVADYCTWALQRKYEQLEDSRSYDLVKHLIRSEWEPFRLGTRRY